MIECVFCNKVPKLIDHVNKDEFDVYLCDGCHPEFYTRFRLLYRKGETNLLVNTIRIEEWFISLNHAPSTTAKKENYTKIYKNIVGEFNHSTDGVPFQLDAKCGVCELDFIVKLPWHDLGLVKQKLQIYTTFS